MLVYQVNYFLLELSLITQLVVSLRVVIEIDKQSPLPTLVQDKQCNMQPS